MAATGHKQGLKIVVNVKLRASKALELALPPDLPLQIWFRETRIGVFDDIQNPRHGQLNFSKPFLQCVAVVMLVRTLLQVQVCELKKLSLGIVLYNQHSVSTTF